MRIFGKVITAISPLSAKLVIAASYFHNPFVIPVIVQQVIAITEK